MGTDVLEDLVRREATRMVDAGDAKIFDDGQLAEAFIPCGEGTLPVGFGHGLLFLATRTGVQISPDGKSIVALQASEVEALEDKIPKGICWIESGNTKNGQLVDHLDEVPAKIVCGMPSEDTTGGAVTRD